MREKLEINKKDLDNMLLTGKDRNMFVELYLIGKIVIRDDKTRSS